MRGKTVKGICLLVLLAAVAVICYRLSYPIASDRLTLPEDIRHFYNRGRPVELPVSVTLYDSVTVGRNEYCLLELGEDLGSVTLEGGPLGRYRLARLGYGGGNFLDGIVEADGKKYLLLGGRDATERIDQIEVTVYGAVYTLEAGGSGHFLRAVEVPAYVEDSHVDRGLVRLYDAAGRDITGDYDLSGGGIR